MDIQKLYHKIDSTDSSSYNKASLLFSIIQIKHANKSFSFVRNSIYIDAKQFIHLYINSIEVRDLGYDIIDTKKLIKSIDICGNTIEQYQLSLFTYRLLKTHGFENEAKVIESVVNRKKTSMLIEKPYKVGKYLRILLHLSTYSLYSLFITIAVLLSLSFIIFLPAFRESWETFDITYHDYSDSFWVNHFLNILSNLFGVQNNFKVETNSVVGILALISIKLFYIVFIVNYLYRKVIDILNNN